MLLYKFKNLPLRWHLTVASLCLAIAALCVGHLLLDAEQRTNRLSKRLSNVTNNTQQKHTEFLDGTSIFTNVLPPRRESDVVVTDISRYASSAGVQIQSIQVKAREANELEYGSVEFAITLSGDYGSTKAWLSKLLSKHRTLAVNTFNMRRGAQNTARIETQASLVFYVKN